MTFELHDSHQVHTYYPVTASGIGGTDKEYGLCLKPLIEDIDSTAAS